MADNAKLPPLPTGTFSARAVAWSKKNLFDGWFNTLLTLGSIAFLVWLIPPLVNWAIVNATLEPTIEGCAEVTGACWGFVNANLRLILFGTYPYDEQWRPLLAMIVLMGIICFSLGGVKYPSLRKAIIPMWVIGVPIIAILMWGGVLGLTYVQNSYWGGLPLTLILSAIGILFAFPLGLLPHPASNNLPSPALTGIVSTANAVNNPSIFSNVLLLVVADMMIRAARNSQTKTVGQNIMRMINS